MISVDEAKRLAKKNLSPKRYEHTCNVRKLAVKLAKAHGADEKKAALAALLHDISAVMRPADMLVYAQEQAWSLAPCEIEHPFLLHQRVSRALAARLFSVKDERVLSPIECHTTLRPGCDRYDLILFLMDKLAWDREGVPPYDALLVQEMEKSPEQAALAYIEYALKNGLILEPHPDLLAAREYLRNFLSI